MKFNANQNTYEDVPPYNCVMCGKHETAGYFDNRRMVDRQFCFICNFWDELAEKVNESIRIDGVHYMNGQNSKRPGKWNGHGGRLFTIKMFSGEIIETCDLWYQGEIPEAFRARMPDNAEFVKIPAPVGHGQGFLG